MHRSACAACAPTWVNCASAPASANSSSDRRPKRSSSSCLPSRRASSASACTSGTSRRPRAWSRSSRWSRRRLSSCSADPRSAEASDPRRICALADHVVTGWGDVSFAKLCAQILAGAAPAERFIRANSRRSIHRHALRRIQRRRRAARATFTSKPRAAVRSSASSACPRSTRPRGRFRSIRSSRSWSSSSSAACVTSSSSTAPSI